MYENQLKIEALSIPNSCTIIGGGGLGSWVAFQCALSGIKELNLFAPGIVRETDLARFPFKTESVGKSRKDALAEYLLEFRPKLQVNIFEHFIIDKHFQNVSGALFNCAAGGGEFDADLVSLAKKLDIPYSSGAYHGLNSGVISDDSIILQPCKDSVPTWVSILSFSASLMLYSAFVKPLSFWGTPDKVHSNFDELRTFVSKKEVAR